MVSVHQPASFTTIDWRAASAAGIEFVYAAVYGVALLLGEGALFVVVYFGLATMLAFWGVRRRRLRALTLAVSAVLVTLPGLYFSTPILWVSEWRPGLFTLVALGGLPHLIAATLACWAAVNRHPRVCR